MARAAAADSEKKEEIIEVFPTTPQLLAAIIFTAVVLVTLLVIRFIGAAGGVQEPPEAEAARYFNSTTLADLAQYEGELIARITRARGSAETPASAPSAEEALAGKLDSALETIQSEKLAAIYSALTEPEKQFVVDSLSDWKLSRLLSVMETQAAAEIVTRLAASQTSEPPAAEVGRAETAPVGAAVAGGP